MLSFSSVNPPAIFCQGVYRKILKKVKKIYREAVDNENQASVHAAP
jgi:hypothetical protein